MNREELDDKYHLAILNPKTGEIFGKEKQFHTLEEVLGWLHEIEEHENREQILTCLMGLRDGKCEVIIHRKMIQAGEQILRIRPPKKFHKLFWEGFGKKFRT